MDKELQEFLDQNQVSKVIVLTDETILRLYSNYINEIVKTNSLIITVPAGEKAKSLSVYETVCQKLISESIDKQALIINIGGGSLCDLGGFVAATYKRGIKFINIPTTLLAMIDASIGGKNAIDFDGVKNSIGTFALPNKIIINPLFLKTLPEYELLNGLGELLKYALIGSEPFWNILQSIQALSAETISPQWIHFCKTFKEQIVKRDMYDQNERHLLNFGHTIGHALEAHFHISHGHAVALGCMKEAHISMKRGHLSENDFVKIEQFVHRFYSPQNIQDSDIKEIISLCRQDKKNNGGDIHAILLHGIGVAEEHIIFPEEIVSVLKS